MPRFLNTWTGKFEWHNRPEGIVYAILSHTWRSEKEGGEQSYDDVCALQAEVADGLRKQTSAHEGSPLSCIFSHPKISDKIKGVCKVAREAGIRLVWNDACCIDKSSSAELSEAINSMYELYRLSQVCYVYLEDVPDDDQPRDQDSRFWRSRWHRRGWTLQELIAPEAVEFLTKTWRFLGTKMGLAATLEEITGVDFNILTGQANVHCASVARRMSWASWRETTRIEDRAYSLMGIFGIHMSPIYGEGDNAFLRLQEEIVRTIPDQSIFAWGNRCSVTVTQVSQHDVQVQIDTNSPDRHFDEWGGSPSLLASDLKAFHGGAHITPIAPSALASRLRSKEVPSMQCVFTPQGVRVQLLSLNLASLSVDWMGMGSPNSCDCHHVKADTLALLQCEDESGSLIALPLCQPRDEAGGSGIGTHIQCNESRNTRPAWANIRPRHCPFHTVRLQKVALAEILEHVTPAIIDVTVLRHYSKPASTKLAIRSDPRIGYLKRIEMIFFLADELKEPPAFRIPPRDIEALGILGFIAETHLTRLVQTPKGKSFIVETSLTFDGGNVPSRAKSPQTIQLTYFNKVSGSYDEFNFEQFYRFGKPVATAQFCVVNFIGVPASPVTTSLPAIRVLGTEGSNDPAYIMMRAPCVDGNEDFKPKIVSDRYSISNRVIADAGFTIYADPDWEKETCTVRFLRVSLAIQNTSAMSRDDLYDPKFYLSIQLSEKYRHTRRIADRTLPGNLPPSQAAGDICEPTTPKQPSSDNDCTSQDAEVLEVTDPGPTVSVATSEQPKDSVPLSGAPSQAPLSDLNEPAEPENVESSRRTTPDQHDSERTEAHDDGTAEAPGTPIQLAPTPGDARPLRASSEGPAAEMENRLSPPTSLRSAVPEWQDQEPVSGDPGPNNTHEGGERSDVGLSERDALRQEVSTLKAQVADLISKNAKMSSQMEEILARLNVHS